MLSTLISELVSPLPPDENGKQRAFDLETAYTLFALLFYMGPPLIEVVFGQQLFNTLTQPTYVLLYAINAYFLYKHRDRVAPLIKGGGLIWVVIFLPLLSTAWSAFPDVTLRRSFALVNTGLFGVYLGARYSLKELVHLLRYTSIYIVAFSLLFGLAFPWWGLMQESHAGAFRGVFTHKNSAAIRLATSFLVFLVSYVDRLGRSRLVDLLGMLLSFGMVIAAQSTTGLGGLLISLAAIPFLFIPRGKLSQMLPAIFGMLLIALTAVLFLTQNTGAVLEAFGEDATLTGRSAFWPVVIDAINQKFWFGWGYQGFWAGGLNGPSAILVHLSTTGPKAHAHNGFLEMLLSVGFIGLSCFLFNVWSSLLNVLTEIRTSRGFLSFFPLLFLAQFFTMNMVETSIYIFNNLTWTLYIALAVMAARWGMRQRSSIQLEQRSSLG